MDNPLICFVPREIDENISHELLHNADGRPMILRPRAFEQTLQSLEQKEQKEGKAAKRKFPEGDDDEMQNENHHGGEEDEDDMIEDELEENDYQMDYYNQSDLDSDGGGFGDEEAF
jgi:hypothetical protein